MSHTTVQTPATPSWDKSALLRLLVVERTMAGNKLKLLELERAGFRCQAHTVCARAEFLDHLRRFRYHVVLAEYWLSGWTGMDALAAMKQAGQDLPLILVAETLGEELAVDCIRQGATDLVLKKHMARLSKAVTQALDEKFTRDARGFLDDTVIAVRKTDDAKAQEFFTLVKNSRDLISVADLHCNVVYINPAGRDLLGLGRADAVEGTHVDDYVAAEDCSLAAHTIFPAILTFGHWQGELRFTHHLTGQTLHFDCLGFLIKDPQTGEPRLVATVSRDLSERRALEEQLLHSRKFEAIGQLAGGMSHDFNNVIGAIQGWAEMGEEQASSNGADVAPYFEKIRAHCDRASALTRQLLTFARRQLLDPRHLSLNQSVLDVLGLLDNVITKNIERKIVLAEDLAAIHADPTQVEQILMNLFINARDAMPNGGHLFIETRNTLVTAEECRRNVTLHPGQFVELFVRDTGMGMNAAVRQRIFEPFFTTKGIGKGTGLGLATVYGIVKQHGGFIRVESEPGLGSTFRLFFPVRESGPAAERPPATIDPSPCATARKPS